MCLLSWKLLDSVETRVENYSTKTDSFLSRIFYWGYLDTAISPNTNIGKGYFPKLCFFKKRKVLAQWYYVVNQLREPLSWEQATEPSAAECQRKHPNRLSVHLSQPRATRPLQAGTNARCLKLTFIIDGFALTPVSSTCRFPEQITRKE